MMTRKDYVATAEILSDFIATLPIDYREQVHDLVEDFADMFAEDNPRFLRNRFVEACYDFEEVG